MNNSSMKSFLSKYHLQLFFFAVALESLAANFAHPITPTLIQNLQLPDYSFGMLYAGMAFTNFLFSPFWAKQVTRMGSRRVLGICCVGYGIGQLLFAIMKTLPTIMLARLLSGFFVGGIMVSFLTYIIHTSTMENRGALSGVIRYLHDRICGFRLSDRRVCRCRFHSVDLCIAKRCPHSVRYAVCDMSARG